MVTRRRVVITGLGVISSIGIGREEFWKSLLEGHSGISRIQRFDTSQYDVHMGGEVTKFEPGDFFDKKETRRLGRAAQFAIASVKLALQDARLSLEEVSGPHTSLCLGTTMADIQALEAADDFVNSQGEFSSPTIRRYALQYPGFMIAAQVASIFHLKGKVFMIPTACAAGNYAIAYGSDLIRFGKSDLALAGGVDPFSRIAFTGFSRIFAVAPERCQPFDKHRKGTIVGEGAGILVLESLEHALNRKASIYAEVLGYGTSCDAHHMTIPNVKGIVRVIQNALVDARISSDEVDYISAHGTGTPANDRAECSAITEVFGNRSQRIPISSIKSMLGHTMGAASALEAISCALAIQSSYIPPTINYETPDPECAINCVPNHALASPVDIALNNSFAFGGNNACVVLGKVHPSDRSKSHSEDGLKNGRQK